jgi:hypothetical protein
MATIIRTLRELTQNRAWLSQSARAVIPFTRGLRFADSFPAWSAGAPAPEIPNPLRDYFESHSTGHGIWKWTHYFDIYHRHLQKFRGQDVCLLEVGIYSGGSLSMWRDYFGPGCKIIGVDIQADCLAYRAPNIDIFIGDQGDRPFWSRVRQDIERLDVVIDDGSHLPEHQIITLEELLPHMAPGGVYICEDTYGRPNYFASYAAGLSARLNGFGESDFWKCVESMHFYPMMTVLEIASVSRTKISSEKRGDQWAPFKVGD